MDQNLAQEGLILCDNCEGRGHEPDIKTLMCHKCWGVGLLDWIERITGKDCPFEVSGASSSSSRSSTQSSRSISKSGEVIKIWSWKTKSTIIPPPS